MKPKRVTIYDIANALEIHASYVSRALNKHHTISEQMIARVKKKAVQLKYKHNSFAANLRKGTSKTVGVIVPKINETFFSNAIAGIEEVCSLKKHHLVICQSYEKYQKELEAVETLIHQSVDCILISLSAETKSNAHLKEILRNEIALVQFDRCDNSVKSLIVENDNRQAAFEAVNHLVEKGYQKIAYIGGPIHLQTYQNRKKGFRDAIGRAKISVPGAYFSETALSLAAAKKIALKLLSLKTRPDAFFTASDYAALGVLQAADELRISVPEELGIIGFQNEEFASFITPSLSSIDQNSIELGRRAAAIYFDHLTDSKLNTARSKIEVVECELVSRQTSNR